MNFSHSRFADLIEIIALAAVPLALLWCAINSYDHTALLTLLVALMSALPFFMRFENAKPRPRDFMPIVVLAALAAAGRIVFGPIPNVMPVTAIVIVAGVSFGKEGGFLTGALAALTSNMFFGQGPWTPWQMYAWGLVGFLAGAFFYGRRKSTPLGVVLIFGCVSSLCYGFLLDSWHVVGFISPLNWKSALAGYAAGVPFNIGHALSTVIFLALIYRPWMKKIDRIKLKFGIASQS